MIVLFLLSAAAATEIQPPAFFAGNEELRTYLLEAADRNPGLQSAFSEWQAAMKSIPQVTSLEDPMLSYQQWLRSTDDNASVAVEQKFPWFGVLKASGDRAAALANAAMERFYDERNRLFARIKTAYFEYAYLAAQIRLTEAQATVLRDVEDNVRSKYTVGLTNAQDLLRVQTEQVKLQDQYSGLLQNVPGLSASLNQELGRSPGLEIAFPQDATLPPTPPPAPVIEARLRTMNFELAALTHQIEGQRKDIELAKKAQYPDITVGIGYGFKRDMKQRRGLREGLDALDAGRKLAADPTAPTYVDTVIEAGKNRIFQDSENVDNEIMVSVKMNVPIYRKRIKAGIEQAEIMEKGVRQRQAQQMLSLGAQAQMALANYRDAVRRLNIYRSTLIPKAKLTYDTIQSSYTTGAEVVFLDLLESERALLEFQLAEAMALRDIQIAAAELERIMGGPWSEEPGAADAAGAPPAAPSAPIPTPNAAPVEIPQSAPAPE